MNFPELYIKKNGYPKFIYHILLIETGRHKNTPRDQRFRPMCKLHIGRNTDE